jgi:hypothetical protein
MAVHTALDCITAALKRIGVVSGIQTPSADLAADGLDRLSSLLESWLTESLIVYAQQRVVQSMTIGKALYTIGTGGDIAQARPLWITNAAVTIPGSSPTDEMPLEPLNDDQWAATSPKLLQSTLPDRYYYNANHPLGEIYPWPVVNITGVSLCLYLPIQLPTTLALTTLIDLPPGYYRAIRDNLAVELAPELDRQIDPNLMQLAIDAKWAIKRPNFRPLLMRSDPALLSHGGYNWLSDE